LLRRTAEKTRSVTLRDIPAVVVTGFPRENLRVAADVVLHKPVVTIV
jgi:hypothetical protein